MNAAEPGLTIVTDSKVSYVRRFLGDYLLEYILMFCTLGIGWLVWFAIVARSGQTPAKQLTNVVIVDQRSGRSASAKKVWLREIVGKYLVPLGVSAVVLLTSRNALRVDLGNLYNLLGGISILLDLMVAPSGTRLRELTSHYSPKQTTGQRRPAKQADKTLSPDSDFS